MELVGQVSTFIMTILTGIVLGALFDCYRVLRSTFNPQAFMTWFTDLLYWLIATAVVFISLVLSNWGELRFYVFVGILGGLGLYYKLLSLLAMRLFIKVIMFIIIVLKFLKKIVIIIFLRPIVYFLRFFIKPFRFVYQKLRLWYKALQIRPPDEEKK